MVLNDVIIKLVRIMKQFFKERKSLIMILFYCFIVALSILLLTSKCSIFYPFNDWVDANAFFTVGKSMMHGQIPYLDIFEQKGPLLYAVYGIGYLISKTTFLGIFIIEVLFWTISLYYVYKIITLFLDKKWSFVIIPLFMSLVCTSTSFAHGGSAEELCLPLFSMTLYFLISHFKERTISKKRLLMAGFNAGCIFLVKYTLLGFWLGFMGGILLSYFLKRDYKGALKSSLYFLLGMVIPIIIAFAYLSYNHALKEFLEVYFRVNIGVYKTITSNSLIRLLKIIGYFYIACYQNGLIGIVLLAGFPLFLLKLEEDKHLKLALILLYVLTIGGIYYGLKLYKYYLFPVFILGLLTIIWMIKWLEKKITLSEIKVRWLFIVSFMGAILISVWGANYKEMRFTKKKDLFQYRFANIIKIEETPTLVNMGFLDCGIFTMADIVPSTYYFELQNIPYENYPNIIEAFREYILNKETMFIVYYTTYREKKLRENETQLFLNK